MVACVKIVGMQYSLSDGLLVFGSWWFQAFAPQRCLVLIYTASQNRSPAEINDYQELTLVGTSCF